MGYTVTVKAKTKKLGDKMIAFMGEHSKSTVLLLTGQKGDEFSFFSDLAWADGERGLSYCSLKGHLGYDYNCGGIDRIHLYALIRWIATKITKGNPRYLYDGNEWVNVGPKEYITKEELEYCKSFHLNDFAKSPENCVKIVLEEVERLDRLWEESLK